MSNPLSFSVSTSLFDSSPVYPQDFSLGPHHPPPHPSPGGRMIRREVLRDRNPVLPTAKQPPPRVRPTYRTRWSVLLYYKGSRDRRRESPTGGGFGDGEVREVGGTGCKAPSKRGGGRRRNCSDDRGRGSGGNCRRPGPMTPLPLRPVVLRTLVRPRRPPDLGKQIRFLSLYLRPLVPDGPNPL